VQKDEAAYEKRFNDDVAKQRSLFTEEYLAQYKTVLNEVINIDLSRNEKCIDRYVETLLQSAEEKEKKDAFSKTALFDETLFEISEDTVLNALISSVRQIIENIEYRPIITKHLDINSLKSLACELIELFWAKNYEKKKKKFVNNIVKEVKESLKLRTSATQVANVDLYRVRMVSKSIERFVKITKSLQKISVISEENVQGFTAVATKRPFDGSGEVRSVSGLKVGFSDAFSNYGDPYNYLQALKENESLTPSEFYKYFVKIDYEILNRDGYKVSGGERSEFRLLQEIKDAQNYDILLIDEPESSFDNIFLMGKVNKIIKEIAETMPVVVVTHNSTVRASIMADYLLYASKEKDGKGIKYRLYSGYPTDRELVSIDGKKKRNFDAMLNSLEAGNSAYNERRETYESIKD
jgi:ABC-type dipeptide/oligopeptide/nickel transport system ATPase subunit